MKGRAPGLALKKRPKVIRKWPIERTATVSKGDNRKLPQNSVAGTHRIQSGVKILV